LRANATGEINDPTSVLFDISLDTMIYYDPHIFRLSYGEKLGQNFELISTIEYQIWDNYKAPTIFIKRNGGVLLPSDDYEKVKVRNIPVARLGLTWNVLEHVSFALGTFWRPSP